MFSKKKVENQQKQNKDALIAEKSSKRKVLIALVTALAIIVSFFSGFFTRCAIENQRTRLLGEIINLINNHSVMIENVSSEQLADALLDGVFDNLDNYAIYYSPTEYNDKQNAGKGNFSGFGFSVTTDENVVVEVVGNSSAYHAGLKKNDKFIAGKRETDQSFIDFEVQQNNGVNLKEFLAVCDIGSQVQFKIERNSEEIVLNITKQNYQASYVEYYDNSTHAFFSSQTGEMVIVEEPSLEKNILSNDCAYISYSAFEGDSANQLYQMLCHMKGKNKSKLIFDLRDNGGGYLHVLCDVASYLINNNGALSYSVACAKEKNSQTIFSVENNRYVEIDEICVLANENTASASESLIGALLFYGDSERDNNFGYENLVLTYNNKHQNYSTYGKGIMQTTYPLFSGGALMLTTAYIMWPDQQTCIHQKGIVQNISENCVEDEMAISTAVEILSN